MNPTSPVWFAFRHPQKQRVGAAWKLDSMSIALVILGTNSFVFHATLRHATQYCDEISMFVLGGSLLQSVYTINQSPAVSRGTTAGIFAVVGLLSAIYIRTGDILHHVYSFNTMILLVGARTIYLIYGAARPELESARLVKLFGRAVAILVVAYILWQLDLEKCLELRRLRQAVGLLWAWLFEFHGWWHVLTALGASTYIRLIRELDNS